MKTNLSDTLSIETCEHGNGYCIKTGSLDASIELQISTGEMATLINFVMGIETMGNPD